MTRVRQLYLGFDASRRPRYPQVPGWKEPGTSRLAAERGVHAETLRAQVLAYLKTHGDHMADETADALGHSVLSIRPRFTELQRLGLIRKAGARRRNLSGCAAAVWTTRRAERSLTMNMQPCRHLDYETQYGPDITLETLDQFNVPVRYWHRGPRWTETGPNNEPNPVNVQFCRLRGRIRGIFQCYNPGELSCYEPETME